MKLFLFFALFLIIQIYEIESIENLYGGYAIKEYNDIKWLNISNNNLILEKNSKKKKANFYIKKCENEKSNNFYYIITIINNHRLCLNEKNILIETCDEDNNEDISKWVILKKNNTQKGYIIQNKKSQRYIGLNSTDDENLFRNILTVKNNINNCTIFLLYKVYEEHIPKETELLKKEPIDILIKYIDLKDATLNREGIKQIKKDEDNEELKYSLRSILQNIPWIRKIFILMPNNKVKFLKSQKKIKEKIVFVKDKDLIGMDSASIYVFQFNLWKMKKFGMSENFILMDDDYFINSPLNKSDFFYEENNQIFPLMISNDYYLMNERKINILKKNYLKMVNRNKIQSEEVFLLRQISSLKFMYKIFREDHSRDKLPLIEASFTHNAIPLKLSDIKEVYDLVIDKYKYINEALNSINRNIYSLHFQTLVLGYVFNQYKRKVHGISCSFIDINNYNSYDTKDKLFVINTSDKNYENNVFILEKKFLEKKFPKATKYELEKGESNDDNDDSDKQKIISKMNKKIKKVKNIKIDDLVLKEYNEEKDEKNNDNKYKYYFLDFCILILFVIIFKYIFKKVRAYILTKLGYNQIQQINSSL